MLSKIRRACYRTARVLGDAQAVTRGRIGQRLMNRWIGRTAARVLRKVWR